MKSKDKTIPRENKVKNIDERLIMLNKRIDACWEMVKMYTEQEDAHGVQDMGVEIQAIRRAIDELKNLDEHL